MNCDPTSLMQSARCMECIPPGMQSGVRSYLLCQWANTAAAPFFWEPAATRATWFDAPHPLGITADLATFNSVSDPETLTRLQFADLLSPDLVAVHNLSSLPLLNSLQVDVVTLPLLTALDLTGCFNLTLLSAGGQQNITAYDFSDCPLLQTVDLTSTGAAILDFSPCPLLVSMDCNTGAVTTVNLLGCTVLTNINCSSNLGMNQAAVDQVLCQTDANGALNGTLNIQVTSVPSAAGLVCSGNLTGKGWVVLHD